LEVDEHTLTHTHIHTHKPPLFTSGTLNSVGYSLSGDLLDTDGDLWEADEDDKTDELESSSPFRITPYHERELCCPWGGGGLQGFLKPGPKTPFCGTHLIKQTNIHELWMKGRDSTAFSAASRLQLDFAPSMSPLLPAPPARSLFLPLSPPHPLPPHAPPPCKPHRPIHHPGQQSLGHARAEGPGGHAGSRGHLRRDGVLKHGPGVWAVRVYGAGCGRPHLLHGRG
jgi:hypothetical protein